MLDVLATVASELPLPTQRQTKGTQKYNATSVTSPRIAAFLGLEVASRRSRLPMLCMFTIFSPSPATVALFLGSSVYRLFVVFYVIGNLQIIGKDNQNYLGAYSFCSH